MIRRRMTLQDFMKLKKKMPFAKFRQDGKSINFGSLFGCSGATLAQTMKKAGFTIEDVNLVIKMFNLEKIVQVHLINGQLKGKSETDIRFAVVGEKFRELFFKTYPGLQERIEREQKYGMKHYFVRAWSGPIRHLPEFQYVKFNARGAPIGADSKLYSRMVSHMKNEAVNTTIQTAEVYVAAPNATAFQWFMKRWGLRTRIFNYTHDSYEIYLFKREREIVYGLLKELTAVNRQPYFGIPQDMSVEESDLTQPDQYLKHGKEISLKGFNLPDKYKEDFQKNINIIPIHGEVK